MLRSGMAGTCAGKPRISTIFGDGTEVAVPARTPGMVGTMPVGTAKSVGPAGENPPTVKPLAADSAVRGSAT